MPGSVAAGDRVMLAPSPASSVNLASPKSRIFSSPVGRQKEVFGLDVPMRDALRMRRGQSGRQLPADVDRLGRRQRAAGERLAQRRALEQLGDEIRLIVVGPDVVDREDVGVVQDCGRAGFLLEAAQPNGIAGPERRQHLDRDIAVEPRIARPVDVAHASGAEGGEDLVRTETASGHNTHELQVNSVILN